MTPAEFLCSLLYATQKAEELHLTVTGAGSFAAHDALSKLYSDLAGAVDSLAEVYQGLEGEALDFSDEEAAEVEASDPKVFVKALQAFVDDNRGAMGTHSAVQNAVDEVLAVIGRARYRLERLS